MNNNPFTPVFGKVPPFLAGRQDVIDPIIEALEEGTNSPDIASLLVGARGMGKTALLQYLSFEAEQRGWVSANVTAETGMLGDIIQRCKESAQHLVGHSAKKRVTGVQVAGLAEINWDYPDSDKANWRTKMNTLLDQLNASETGFFITVDEIDPRLPEMRQLVDTFQHFMREDRKVALLMAGLPHNVSNMISKYTTTFLRRAARHAIGPIPTYEVEEAFRLTIEQGNRRIESTALENAVRAIGGFPFMFQLVGYRSWNVNPDSKEISERDVEIGIRLASTELKDRVFDATYATLSEKDRRFVKAMLQDSGTTQQSDLATRLGVTGSHVSTYKRRLLDQGIIEERTKGRLSFCLPGFKEYVASALEEMPLPDS